MNNQQSEVVLHQQVCDYLRLQYPNVLFRTDMAGHVKLTMPQATAARRVQAGRAWPDLFVCEPRDMLHGLFIELKREGTKIWLRNGKLTSDPHIREQYEVLSRLGSLGYWAVFAIGFDEAKKAIDDYLSL